MIDCYKKLYYKLYDEMKSKVNENVYQKINNQSLSNDKKANMIRLDMDRIKNLIEEYDIHDQFASRTQADIAASIKRLYKNLQEYGFEINC